MRWFRYIVGRGLAPAVLLGAIFTQTDRRGRRSLQVRRGANKTLRKSHKMKKFVRISTLLFFSFTVFTKSRRRILHPPPFILDRPTFLVSPIGVLKKCFTLFGVSVWQPLIVQSILKETPWFAPFSES